MTVPALPVPCYRVDKFIVPAAARAEFLARVAATHEVLRRQAGFARSLVLEQAGGPGAFNFVTLVEWADAAAFEQAVAVVAAAHRASGFDRQAAMARLGITADMATYRPLAL
jgi:hypothetical protein